VTNKTFIIAGGSWGCGEWRSVAGVTGPTAAGGIAHPGIAKYLLDSGYQVINLCQPGGANKHGADRVASFLGSNKHLNIDGIIVFQTEWIRDVFVERPSMIADDLTHGYHNLKYRILSRFYHLLSSTSVQHDVPIYLIGSDSDTIWLDRFAEEYPGLHIACQSMTNLLIYNDHRNMNPVHCIFDPRDEEEIAYIKKHSKNADLELLLEDIDRGSRRVEVWAKHKEYFYPDGFHANRDGHRVLFEFLKERLAL
jgi:hypothetical protein